MARVVFLRFIVSAISEELVVCQTVFSLGYYSIKKTTKTYKSQGMQLSPMTTADVTLKTQNEIGGCLTQQINALLFVMACQSLCYLLNQLRS